MSINPLDYNDEEVFEIPEGTTVIPQNAFERPAFGGRNPFLKQVIIPDSVEIIEKGAFANCSELEEIIIPDSVTEMGEGVFKGCANLKKVVLPRFLDGIPEDTFYNCSSLQEINLPSKCEYIGSEAFYNCSSLSKIDFPNSLAVIHSCAFAHCYGLHSVTLPPKLQRVESYCFKMCKNLENVSLSNSIRTIMQGAFLNCKNLQKIDFPEGLERILEGAFEGCESFQNVFIPSTVDYIGEGAFYINDLQSINVDERNNTYSSLDGMLLNNDLSTLLICPLGKTTVVIPDCVNLIETGAFGYINFDVKKHNICIMGDFPDIKDFAFSVGQSLILPTPENTPYILPVHTLNLHDLNSKSGLSFFLKNPKYDYFNHIGETNSQIVISAAFYNSDPQKNYLYLNFITRHKEETLLYLIEHKSYEPLGKLLEQDIFDTYLLDKAIEFCIETEDHEAYVMLVRQKEKQNGYEYDEIEFDL